MSYRPDICIYNASYRPDICIYHANCLDGFTAAWIVRRRFGLDVKFVPAGYGDGPPDVTDKHVLIVDFSYPLPQLAWLASQAASVTVLDHHKTAREALADFAVPGPLRSETIEEVRRELCHGRKTLAVFDMAKSGARLAWEFCFGYRPEPRLVTYVEDRDLWRFHYSATKPFIAWLQSWDFSFDHWDMADGVLAANGVPKGILAEGEAILRREERAIADALTATRRSMVIGGHRVSVANVPYQWASEAGNIMAHPPVPFAATYFDAANGERVFSLRSHAEGLDVAAIAQRYGGGGHRNAAGFRAARGWEGDAA